MVKKVIMATALALTASLSAQAQLKNDKNVFNHLSVGVSVGTTGAGFEVGTTICPVLTLRAGMDFMPNFNVGTTVNVDRPEALKNVSGELLATRYIDIPDYGVDIDVKGTPNKTQGKAFLDIYPGRNSAFHFTVGATFGSSTLATIKATDKAIAAVELYNDDVRNGYLMAEPGHPNGFDIELEGYSVGHSKGRVRLDAQVMAVRPYFGIGVGRTVPRHRVGAKFELGAEYMGKIKLVDAYANNGAGYTITQDTPGISSDFRDVLKYVDKVPVYPTLKLTIFGRIF